MCAGHYSKTSANLCVLCDSAVKSSGLFGCLPPMYAHPDRPGHVTVPHPRKDLGVGLLHKLLKQTDLND